MRPVAEMLSSNSSAGATALVRRHRRALDSLGGFGAHRRPRAAAGDSRLCDGPARSESPHRARRGFGDCFDYCARSRHGWPAFCRWRRRRFIAGSYRSRAYVRRWCVWAGAKSAQSPRSCRCAFLFNIQARRLHDVLPRQWYEEQQHAVATALATSALVRVPSQSMIPMMRSRTGCSSTSAARSYCVRCAR